MICGFSYLVFKAYVLFEQRDHFCKMCGNLWCESGARPDHLFVKPEDERFRSGNETLLAVFGRPPVGSVKHEI